MKQTLDVINEMEHTGVIGRYAIAGAVAAYNYIEPTLTEDLDILISFANIGEMRPGLVTLSPIYTYLQAKGYREHRKEGLVIEGWPVQFLPVASDLDAEALAEAMELDLLISPAEGSVKTRVLRPEHLVATALRVGRPKDYVRITQFLEEETLEIKALCNVLERHNLIETWRLFCKRFDIIDPCKAENST